MERIGRYKIEAELGRGAMGIVYRALDPAIGRTVAIKTIRLTDVADLDQRDRLRDRLLHEARSAGLLSHPGIVTVYDVAEQDALAYIAMEFVNGRTLEEVLSLEEPPGPEMIFRVLRETAAALDHAHKKGIVHRDIKPANIMIHEDGTVKITDFGVAKIPASQLATQAGVVVGTPCYMSPEQALGKPVDGRSDQFSLAVIAFEMLTGEKPFKSEQLAALVYKIAHQDPPSPLQLNPTLGWQVEVVLRRALEKGPAARFATCTEFVGALEAACKTSKGWKPLPRAGGQSLPTVSVGVAEPQPEAQPQPAEVGHGNGRSNRRNKVIAGILSAAGLLAAMGLAGVWLSQRRLSVPPPPPPPPAVQAPAVKPVDSAAPGDRPSPSGPVLKKAETETPATPPPAAAPSVPKPETGPAAADSATPLADAKVLIRTTPPGATAVFDDDRQLSCQSPCSIWLPRGRHTVSASIDGYRPSLRIFRLPEESEVFLYLPRINGHVQVLSSPPGAAILVDGQPRSETTPATLDLPAGKYSITVIKDGFQRNEQEVEVKDSAFIRLNFTLGR